MKTKLQKELKQNTPFTSKGHEVVVGLLRTADHLRRQISEITKPYGITPQHYNVLRILRGAGEDGLPILEISNRMIENSPGITRFITFLESKKLITRKKSSEDKRRQICKISGQGLKVLKELDHSMENFNKEVTSSLSEEQLGKLIDYLDEIRSEK